MGIAALLVILVLGTMWMGSRARDDTDAAVRTVSLLYLDELAGRREQVVAGNMRDKIDVIGTILDLMTEEDLSGKEHLMAYQAKMKRLFKLEKFAFVDEEGLIYTSLGMSNDIEEYSFDYHTLSEPEISIKNLQMEDKQVIIAYKVDKAVQSEK